MSATAIERARISQLTMLELLTEITEKAQKYLHIEELKKRLQNKQIAEFLTYSASIEEESTSGRSALKEEADEILVSSWTASTLYNPENAIGLLRTISNENLYEQDLSERQHKFLLSIRSHYKSWCNGAATRRRA